MEYPLESLIIGLGIVALLAFVFWPKSGVIARIQKSRFNTRRVLLEDALKHIYNYEIQKQTPTLQSIAGTLSVSSDTAAKIIARLESLALLKTTTDGFRLTPEGRSYALRIIRTHRLWERYLADETGLKEKDWHPAAEVKEHLLTPAQANRLAAKMGNPQYDPHGDPIPSATGELPPAKGQPLMNLREGEVAQIIHIEDEPETIYAQLVAEGLYPGIRIQLLDVTKERVRFIAKGEEKVLAPVFAANITVVPLIEKKEVEGKFDTLSSLRPGERGEVIEISRASRGAQRRRLMDLGIIPGTIITVEMRSPGGDPTAYQVRGATIALRKEQADSIFIKKIGNETNGTTN